MKFSLAAMLIAGLVMAGPAHAADLPTSIIKPGEDTVEITALKAPGGEAILPTAKDKAQNHDQYGYAAVRRLGKTLYLSGVIAGRLPGEGTDVEALKTALRRAFTTIQRNLKAAGSDMEDIAEIQTFADFKGPNFKGDTATLLGAYLEVKKEFIQPPYPAETLVGITNLAEPNGIMDIRVTANAHGKPRKKTTGKPPEKPTEKAAP